MEETINVVLVELYERAVSERGPRETIVLMQDFVSTLSKEGLIGQSSHYSVIEEAPVSHVQWATG